MFGLEKIDIGKAGGRRAVAIASVALFLLLLLWGGTLFSSKYAGVKRLLGVKAREAATFKELKVKYLTKKGQLDFLRRKALSIEPRSVVALVGEIGKEAGVSGRIVSLKSLGESADDGYIKSGVELEIERIELDELVNLLYMIQHNRLLFVINDFRLKARFDNPDLMDVTLKLTRVKKGI